MELSVVIVHFSAYIQSAPAEINLCNHIASNIIVIIKGTGDITFIKYYREHPRLSQ